MSEVAGGRADDLALLTAAVRAAGDMALRLREGAVETWSKAGGSPVTAADLAVDAQLKRELTAARPDYGWLSEETADDPARLGKRRVFVVDPIDGTVAFVKRRPWWCVCAAVVEDGRPVAGAVYAPVVGELYAAAAGAGATLNGAAIHASPCTDLAGCGMLGDAKMFADPRWPAPWPPMRVEARNAVAYRMCLVAAGAFDAAVALSGKGEWDVAAAEVIAREAGALVSDMHGAPFRYNRPEGTLPSLVCAAPALHPLILSRLAHIRPLD